MITGMIMSMNMKVSHMKVLHMKVSHIRMKVSHVHIDAHEKSDHENVTYWSELVNVNQKNEIRWKT